MEVWLPLYFWPIGLEAREFGGHFFVFLLRAQASSHEKCDRRKHYVATPGLYSKRKAQNRLRAVLPRMVLWTTDHVTLDNSIAIATWFHQAPRPYEMDGRIHQAARLADIPTSHLPDSSPGEVFLVPDQQCIR
jgi:hypothetical protein